MIGHFPDPYPDELLYSVCARYSERMRYPSKQPVIRDLFGIRNVIAVVDLPSHLDHLINNLPPGNSYTLSALIDDHTLLPFYGPFLPMDRLERIRQDMCGDQRSTIAARIGTAGSSIPLPQWLRFCPQCVEEDRQKLGECYWHRIHQASGVLVCPFHAIQLQNSKAPARNSKTRYEFIPAEQGVKIAARNSCIISHFYHEVLLRIARDVVWLLKQRELVHGPELLRKKYIATLANHSLVSRTGRVRTDDLIREFNNFYPLFFFKRSPL